MNNSNIWLSIALCLTLCGCNKSASDTAANVEQTPKTAKLLRVQVDGKIGFIDGTGKIVIPTQYESMGEFSEGLASVCVGECSTEHILGYRYDDNYKKIDVEQSFKYGFIDESGKFAINPMFEDARKFSEGLAAVCEGKGCYYAKRDTDQKKWGFIDKQGKMIITPQFDDATEFHEGLAAVGVGGKYGYIDKTGSIVINPLFESEIAFDGGFAMVSVKEPGADKNDILTKYKWGYIDKTGKYIWQPSR
jgi:hypothetical protein